LEWSSRVGVVILQIGLAPSAINITDRGHVGHRAKNTTAGSACARPRDGEAEPNRPIATSFVEQARQTSPWHLMVSDVLAGEIDDNAT